MRYFIGLIAMFLTTVSLAAPPRTIILQVKNMTCATCPIVVRKSLQRVPGVSAATVDFDRKTATVTFDPDRVKPATLTKATTNAGFPSSLSSAP